MDRPAAWGRVPRPDAPSPGGSGQHPHRTHLEPGAHPAPQRPGSAAPRPDPGPRRPPRALTPPLRGGRQLQGGPSRRSLGARLTSRTGRGLREHLSSSWIRERGRARAPLTPQAREAGRGSGAGGARRRKSRPPRAGRTWGGAARGRSPRTRALPPLGPGAACGRGYGGGGVTGRP